ncbi:hypothetical protein ACS0TY_006265 [Phlomoides rotata]
MILYAKLYGEQVMWNGRIERLKVEQEKSSLWDAAKFIRSSSWDMDGVVIVNGFWKDNGWRCCVVNIYSPCILAEKLDLWDRILGILE